MKYLIMFPTLSLVSNVHVAESPEPKTANEFLQCKLSFMSHFFLKQLLNES